jgi:hypothetical protein
MNSVADFTIRKIEVYYSFTGGIIPLLEEIINMHVHFILVVWVYSFFLSLLL